MDSLLDVKNVTVSIHRPAEAVYAFVTDGDNIPRWAKGLGTTMRRDNDDWIADGGPIGKVRVHFTPKNDLGVADHAVTLSNGVTVHNPIRVLPNGTGATVIFTLMRLPDRSEHDFETDANTVLRDLQSLKALLEQSST